jgi:anion-transporting  ArsA/GET3 family ATPase
LHVVTGKGGTGKTTVAAALALALAAGGKKVLLVEVEGRQGIAQVFDTAPLPYEERKIAVAADGGDVLGLAIEPHAAVLEYLDMYYRAGFAAKTLDRMGALDFATTIAPGLRDVLLTGKTYEAVRRLERRGGHTYDHVVLDAPPTGRIVRFLDVNSQVSSLARVGPIHRQASSVSSMMHSATTVVHLVTILEEMPVQETIDGVADLRHAEFAVGAIIVNMVRPSPLQDSDLASVMAGQVDADILRSGLVSADLPVTDEVVTGLRSELLEHGERARLQADERERLAATGLDRVELPRLSTGIGLGELYELSERLRQAMGVATR